MGDVVELNGQAPAAPLPLVICRYAAATPAHPELSWFNVGLVHIAHAARMFGKLADGLDDERIPGRPGGQVGPVEFGPDDVGLVVSWDEDGEVETGSVGRAPQPWHASGAESMARYFANVLVAQAHQQQALAQVQQQAEGEAIRQQIMGAPGGMRGRPAN